MEYATKDIYNMTVNEREDVAKAEVARGVRKVHDWTYEMIYNSGIDAGVELRRDNVPMKQLFLLPSQQKYFIVDLTTDAKRKLPPSERICEALDEANYTTFMSHMSGTLRYEHMVFNELGKTKNWKESFFEILANPYFPEYAKLHKAQLSKLDLTYRWGHSWRDWTARPKYATKLHNYIDGKCKELKYTDAEINNLFNSEYSRGHCTRYAIEFFETCLAIYGWDITIKCFVDPYLEDTDLGGFSGRSKSLFGHLNGGERIATKEFNNDMEAVAKAGLIAFDAKTLSNYLYRGSKRQGRADSLGAFMETMGDVMDLQKRLYKKVKEKYSPTLYTYHDQLAYKVRLRGDLDESEIYRYEESAKGAAKFAGKYKDYILVPLLTVGEVIDEAEQQSNCVKSYIQRVIRGQCYLASLRKADKPEDTICTTEIVDGEVVQFLGAYNRRATAMEWDAVMHIMLQYYEANKMSTLVDKTKKYLKSIEAEVKQEYEDQRKHIKRNRQVQAEL